MVPLDSFFHALSNGVIEEYSRLRLNLDKRKKVVESHPKITVLLRFQSFLPEDEGDMDVAWDITFKDVERLRQFLTPTIHTLIGHVHDKEKIVTEEEHDCDIPLHDGVMQPLTPQKVHITPPDYVAVATNPILNKQLNEFREEFSDITRVAKKANGDPVNNVKELFDIKTYDCETIIPKLLHQVSQSSHKTGMTKREMKSHQR
ncbi:hypothetical protein Tco_1187460, partial [Tanacetum coccineum]